MHKNNKPKNKPRKTLLILLLIIAIPLVGLTGFYLYVQFNTYPAAEEQLAMIYDHPDLQITENKNLITTEPGLTNNEQQQGDNPGILSNAGVIAIILSAFSELQATD